VPNRPKPAGPISSAKTFTRKTHHVIQPPRAAENRRRAKDLTVGLLAFGHPVRRNRRLLRRRLERIALAPLRSGAREIPRQGPFEPLADAVRWLVAEQTACLRDVCEAVADVAGAERAMHGLCAGEMRMVRCEQSVNFGVEVVECGPLADGYVVDLVQPFRGLRRRCKQIGVLRLAEGSDSRAEFTKLVVRATAKTIAS